MSTIFGPMRQLGYVVPDMDAAIEQWLDRGVGPWFHLRRHLTFDVVYEGAVGTVEVSIALAHSGDLQIELIQQHNDTPSTWQEFLAAGRTGPHHWSSWPTDFAACYQRAVDAGYQVTQEGVTSAAGYAYFRDKSDPERMIEIATLDDARDAMHATLLRAADGWDGRDPIRDV